MSYSELCNQAVDYTRDGRAIIEPTEEPVSMSYQVGWAAGRQGQPWGYHEVLREWVGCDLAEYNAGYVAGEAIHFAERTETEEPKSYAYQVGYSHGLSDLPHTPTIFQAGWAQDDYTAGYVAGHKLAGLADTSPEPTDADAVILDLQAGRLKIDRMEWSRPGDRITRIVLVPTD